MKNVHQNWHPKPNYEHQIHQELDYLNFLQQIQCCYHCLHPEVVQPKHSLRQHYVPLKLTIHNQTS